LKPAEYGGEIIGRVVEHLLGKKDNAIIRLADTCNSSIVEMLNLAIRRYSGKDEHHKDAWPVLVMLALLEVVEPNFRADIALELGHSRMPRAHDLDMQRTARQAASHAGELDPVKRKMRARRAAMNILARRLAISGDYKRCGRADSDSEVTSGRVILLSLFLLKHIKLKAAVHDGS